MMAGAADGNLKQAWQAGGGRAGGWTEGQLAWGCLLLALLIVLGIALTPGLGSSSSWPEAKIISETADQIVISVTAAPYSLETVEVDGTTYTRIMGSGLAPFAREGQPNLPVLPLLIALPPGGNARIVSVERFDERQLEGVRVAPVEGFAGNHGQEAEFAEYVYAENDSVYGEDLPFPAESAWLKDRGRLRHQDVVRLVVAPFIYLPASGRVTASGRLAITLRFERGRAEEGAFPHGGTGRGAPEGIGRDVWEGVYRDAVLNCEQGRRWRIVPRPALGAPRGLGADNERAKITVAKTGLYRLWFDALSASGFPQGVPLDQVFVYRDTFVERGEDLPDSLVLIESAIAVIDSDGDSVFSSGDAIEFFARDFYDEYGRQGNEDFFFDKNVYWVSWGEGDHRRITSKPGWRDAVAPTRPTHFTDFIHVERDSYFVNFPPQEDMDTFVWTRLRRVTPFHLPGVDTTIGTTLTARFVNYYNYYDREFPRPSKITLFITGCGNPQVAVDTVETSLPSARVLAVPLGAGSLCERDNRFRFESSILDVRAIPGNVLDWFEVTYERKYEAFEDSILFTNAEATGEVEYEVGGFTVGAIRLFDVTDAANPVAVDLSGDQVVAADGGFTIAFRDSIDGAKRYLALTDANVLEVAASDVSLRPPPRSRGIVADYLVVSHPNFLAEIDRIVSRRTAQGYSIFVTTPDEVYDDFGNGIKSDVAIKRFMKEGFLSGDAAFALLVGDANTDHRGLLLVPPVGSTQPPSDVDYVPTHTITRLEDERPNKELRPSDTWFVNFGWPSDDYPDLYLGRLPVGSAAEARTVVDKIVRFEDYSGEDPWKKRVLLVADDEYKFTNLAQQSNCYAGERDFMWACDSVAVVAKDFATVALDTVKYYLKRCVKDDQPTKRCERTNDPLCCTVASTTQSFTRTYCTPALRALMNQSALLVNYQGHANRDRFTHEWLIMDGGNNVNPNAYTDIRGLANTDKPFIFAGYGCWISEFARRSEPQGGIQDAIGEKFLTAPTGGACASFASGCSELIGTNRLFNPYVARAMFHNLQGVDPQGNLIPARILMGEVVTAALVRFGMAGYSQRHLLFGDPAMVVDMGPPLVTVAVNDSLIDEAYVFEGEAFDTLEVVSEVRDEEAIMAIDVDLVEGGTPRPVPPSALSVEPLSDLDLTRSRVYRVTYKHVPALGECAIRTTATDYAGKQRAFEFRVSTGSAVFYGEAALLDEGDSLVFGQTLRAVVARPFAFTEEAIVAMVDTVPADSFDTYSVEKLDQEGKRWQVSLVPSLASGDHVFRVAVDGFAAERTFHYVGVAFGFSVDGRNFFDNDFVSADAEVVLLVSAEGQLNPDDIGVEIDGTPQVVQFEPEGSENHWRGVLDLGSVAILPGQHTLAVKVGESGQSRRFRTSDDLGLVDVSVFPNPFSSSAYFYYTLTLEATRARLMIFTVAGRKIADEDLGTLAGYNQYRWEGLDSAGDLVANGTYIYKLIVESGRGTREFTGSLVKID